MSVQPSATLLCRRRRGSIYPAVLAYASLVTIIGLSALLALRVQRRACEGEIDFSQARLHARSAIELGMWAIENDTAWRTTLSSGVWVKDRSIGSGTYTLEGVDPNDDNLADSDLHPLVLTGTGAEGDARHKTQVRLEPVIKPLDCLGVSLHAGANLKFDTAILRSDQTISANGRVDSTNSMIVAGVEAVTSINGTQYTGTTTTGIEPRSMPTSSVFDYYLSKGTVISYEALADMGSARKLVNALLSPKSNPFGEERNSAGIYVIDCAGKQIVITDSRIVGTLVLLNPRENSLIEGSVLLEPAVEDYPTLLVRGSIEIKLDGSMLSEDAAGNTNFNPEGTPYREDQDSDAVDLYASLIRGLVYVSGDLFNTGTTVLEGTMIVGGTLSAGETMDLTYQSTYFDLPPPGFREVPRMQVVDGSWQQVVD